MDRSHADENAKKAIAFLLRGDVDEGIELYRQSLKVDHLLHTPVGIHLMFLERAGQKEAAARLLDLAIGQGADVAVKAGGFGTEPPEAAAEYEALFAGGIVNSRMIFEYLRVLAQLGRWPELRRILDVKKLLRVVRLDLANPKGRAESLASAVEALLGELELRSEHRISSQSVRQMNLIKKFSNLRHPAAKALMAALSGELTSYLADWRSSDHPFASRVPQGFEIDAWGLISRSAGYVAPHIHAKGWATGVYYPSSVEAGAGAELVIGKPEGAAGSDADWGTARLRPQSGLLVLMPSYYTHWTIPRTRPGLRTSIAFDVLPSDATGIVN